MSPPQYSLGSAPARAITSPTPVAREILTGLVGRTCALEDVIADIQDELLARPYELVFVAGDWHHRTRPRFADAIRRSAVAERRSALDPSSTDLAVLAAIAYLQPPFVSTAISNPRRWRAWISATST